MLEIILLLLGAALFIVYAGLKVFARTARNKALGLEQHYDQLHQTAADLARERAGLSVSYADFERRLMDISSLYEITKRMSASLELEDVFKVLKDYLRENLKFRKAQLIFMEPSSTDAEPQPERILEVHFFDSPAAKKQTPEADSTVLRKICYEKKRIVQRLPSNVIAVPFLEGGQVASVFLIEDILDQDFERFIILANELGLMLKKINLYKTVQELSIVDGLTNVYLRRYYMKRLEEELERSRRLHLNMSLVMLDIDDFKVKNDTHGHLVGDAILREVASLIKKSIREIDLVGRYGGEEFSVLLPDTDLRGALFVSERIRSTVESHTIRAYDEVLNVTLSAGVAVYPQLAATQEELLERADIALYRAKKSGKNRVEAYQ